jgi:fructokinase
VRIGIDLGGTKTEAVVLDKAGDVVFRERRATPRGSYDGTIDAIADLVRAAEAAVAVRCSVGVGMPGAISPATGLVKNANSTWLNGRRLHEDLEARLGRPVRLANDANCFALSEASDGAAAGASVVFGVIIGTGCGGGVVVGGQVLTGPNAVAGEWGHNPLPWPADDERPGPPCYCGKHGCLETFVSGTGLALDYSSRTQTSLDAAAVVARAASGEPDARAAMDRYVDRLARGLANVINLLDPDVIVLGGGMSNATVLYSGVPARLPQYVFSDRVSTRLVPPRHGDSSGVRGAAWLWGRQA